MKTLEALYQEVLTSEELKEAFSVAMTENRTEEFLKANGCEADTEELEAFLKDKQEKQGELADEELDSVAGGCGPSPEPIILETCPFCLQDAQISRDINYRYGTVSCRCKLCGNGWFEPLSPEDRMNMPEDY